MDRLVGDITRCGRASADGRRGAYYVDMSAMDPAGPRPGVVRPASPQWHAQLSSITTRAVSLRARSPVQGDPALGRVWVRSPSSAASTPRGTAWRLRPDAPCGPRTGAPSGPTPPPAAAPRPAGSRRPR